MSRLSITWLILLATCDQLVPYKAWCQTVFVSNYGSSSVESFSLAGADLGLFAITGSQPHDIAFDTARNVYVASYESGVQKFSPSGTLLQTIPNPGIADGIVFNQSGNMYVTNNSYDAPGTADLIEKFSPTGADLGAYITSGISEPAFPVFDASGNLFVPNVATNTVEKFSPAGADLGVFANTGLWGPDGTAFDAAGNLYVSNYFGSTIEKFSPNGTDLGPFITTGLSAPTGITFDHAGNLYVANFGNGTVEKFSPTGTDLGAFASGLNGPNAIAISPVPEPSSIVLFGIGVVLPVVVRRRVNDRRRC